jgi:hypothetical protein
MTDEIPSDGAGFVNESGSVLESCAESVAGFSLKEAELPICCPNGHGILPANKHCFSCGWPDSTAVARWQSRGGKPFTRDCGQCNARVLITTMGKCSVCGLDLLTASEQEKIKQPIFANGNQRPLVLTSQGNAFSKKMAGPQDSYLAFQVRASWLFPLLIWISQIVFSMLMWVIRPEGLMVFLLCLTIMLAQAFLLVAGICLGVVVLMQDPLLVTPKNRMIALLGLGFSAGTIAVSTYFFLTQ